jgi:hypothetical protein
MLRRFANSSPKSTTDDGPIEIERPLPGVSHSPLQTLSPYPYPTRRMKLGTVQQRPEHPPSQSKTLLLGPPNFQPGYDHRVGE